MPTQEMFFFLVPQAAPKKPYRTRYRLTLQEAAERYPGAEPILSTKEVREVGDRKLVPASEEIYALRKKQP